MRSCGNKSEPASRFQRKAGSNHSPEGTGPMAEREALTADYVRQILHYDPETGVFTRLKLARRRDKIGSEAGGFATTGYVTIGIEKKAYLAHRLAWLWMTGKWPKEQIDHINMCRSDNRWVNLREADKYQNKHNKKRTRKSISGLKGVTWHAHSGLWHATIRARGIKMSLGYFNCRAAASFAYQVAADKLHGKFARPM